MIAKDVREYFSRHFLGKVKVRRLDHSISAPQVFSCGREAEIHSLHMTMKVEGARMFSFSEDAAFVRRVLFSEQSLRVRGSKIGRYALGEIVTRAVRPLRKSKVRADLKRLQVLPQERTNRLHWQRSRPRTESEKEMVLGWFAPVIEDAVVNLVLNRQQGTLLIWYNPQSRRYNARGLYLYRRLGIDENLEWRWA